MPCFVDDNPAGNIVTTSLYIGVCIYVVNATIIWFSKKWNIFERRTFGSEFVAMQIARDVILVLNYKLSMFDVPFEVPFNVMCDNKGVINSTILPQSNLGKKHNAINYHVVCEAAVAGILWVGKEKIDTNFDDILKNI